MRLHLFLTIAFVLSSLLSGKYHAQDDLTPKYVNEFLNIGVGARALGMSLSQVASVNDVTSGYWNPAGLMGVRSDLEIAAMHSEYFAGIAKYDYGAAAKPIDSLSAASISFVRFGVDDIPNTIDLFDPSGNINYDRITTFSAADYAFILSYARKGLPWKSSLTSADSPLRGLRWGVNAKVIYRQVGDFANAWGFGLDAGAQFGYRKWQFGLMARDITSTFNAWTYTLDDRTREVFAQTGNAIPENGLEIALPRLILGGARRFDFRQLSLLAEANAVLTTDGRRNTLISASPVSIDPTLGLEVGYRNIIFLRMGAGNVQRIKDFDGSSALSLQPNMGIGLRIRQLQLDYALSDIGNVSDVLYSNVFSLRFSIIKGQGTRPASS